MHACPVFAVDEDINGSSGLILLPFHLFINADRAVANGRTAAVSRAVITGVTLIGSTLIALNASLSASPMSGRVLGCFEPVLTAPVVAGIIFSKQFVFPAVSFELIVVVDVSFNNPALRSIFHPLKDARIKSVRKLFRIVAVSGHRAGWKFAWMTPRKAVKEFVYRRTAFANRSRSVRIG